MGLGFWTLGMGIHCRVGDGASPQNHCCIELYFRSYEPFVYIQIVPSDTVSRGVRIRKRCFLECWSQARPHRQCRYYFGDFSAETWVVGLGELMF